MLGMLLQQLDCPVSAGHSRRCVGADRSASRKSLVSAPGGPAVSSPRLPHSTVLRKRRLWASPGQADRPLLQHPQSSAQPTLPGETHCPRG